MATYTPRKVFRGRDAATIRSLRRKLDQILRMDGRAAEKAAYGGWEPDLFVSTRTLTVAVQRIIDQCDDAINLTR